MGKRVWLLFIFKKSPLGPLEGGISLLPNIHPRFLLLRTRVQKLLVGAAGLGR